MADKAALLAMLLAGTVLSASAWPGRSAQAVAEFRKVTPCPATGKTRGACHGWEVEHTRPLCAGGADEPANMTWMRKEDHKRKTKADLQACRALKRQAGP